MTKLVTILGGSGFVGRYIARRMAKEGWRVRVATRRPNENLFVRTYGAVGQVEPVLCNIRNEASIRAAVAGADAVINCAGIMAQTGKNNFAAVQTEGPGLVARAAADAGVAQLVHISALGADAGSDSDYARSKGEGEAAVLAAFPAAVILRPSVVFGPEDKFFNRFAGMTRFSPVLAIASGDTKFQPVYVDDVAAAAVNAALGKAAPGVYELGGPDVMSFRAMMEMMLAEIRRKRLVISLPGFVARFAAGMLSFGQFITGGLFVNDRLTADQLRLLKADNVVSEGARGLADLGVEPTPMALILPTYLWRFRPAGQYEAFKEAAQELRSHHG